MSIWEFWHGTAEVARAHAETRTCTYVKTIFPNPKEAGLNVCRSERALKKKVHPVSVWGRAGGQPSKPC